MKKFLQFLKPYKLLFALTVIFTIFDVAGALFISRITADIINIGINTKDMNYIVQKGLLMFGVAILSGIATLISSYLCADLTSKVAKDIRVLLYKKSLEISGFKFKQISSSSMITRTLNDVNIISETFVMFIQMILPVPFMCIIAIAMTFSINTQMGILLTSITVLILIFAIIITKKSSVIFDKLQTFLDKMNALLRENITGVRVIRAFNKEKYEEKRLKKSFESYSESAIKANRIFSGLDAITTLIINVIIVVILWIGGNQVGKGTMAIGDISAVIEYAILILYYLMMAQMAIVLVPRALVCLNRVTEVLETEIDIKDGKDKFRDIDTNNILEFKHVTFKYEDADEDTLRNISFDCRKGETTAIIGSTGSGKSTMADLIMRFYDTTTGGIYFKEQNIKKISQEELRKHISYVPQTAWLFSGTIEENLRYGNKKASKKELMNSLQIAQSDFVNELDKKMDSKVSQGGKNFSGGQKQRIAIARALTKKADLYIFDDSFSALDFKTDSMLRKALSKSIKDSAILIIAQRVNTILNANQIIVLNDGEIVGCGTHQELMEKCQIYQEIAKSQMKEGV